METVCIIPARGGSKGIIGKNMKLMAGRPLISWVISAALKARSIDRLFVSTDSKKIAQIAVSEGAEVIMRPSNLALDNSPSELALIHALNHLKTKQNYDPNLLVFLQCTSPLTPSEDIDAAVKLHQSEKVDTVIAVIAAHPFIWRKNNFGYLEAINHDPKKRPPRQEIDQQFLEIGAIYVMKAQEFRKHGKRYAGKILPFEMQQENVSDIDNLSDFTEVEKRLKDKLRQIATSKLPRNIKAVLFDFDGVFTDNRCKLEANGNESVFCSHSDDIGIKNLQDGGYSLAVISEQNHPIVSVRCKKLGILDIITNADDKGTAFNKWSQAKGIPLNKIVYLGNDTDDLECLNIAGCGVVVADAHPQAIKIADLQLSQCGGKGAIRELSDLLLKK